MGDNELIDLSKDRIKNTIYLTYSNKKKMLSNKNKIMSYLFVYML